jgi:hypothetical protein
MAVLAVAALIGATAASPAYAAPDAQSDPAPAVADDTQRQARAATPGPAVENSLAGPLYGPYHIENVRSGLCLTIQGASTATNALALQYTCNTTAPYNEDWWLEDLSPGDNWYHFVNGHSGLCLTVQGASTANNARTLQYPCDYSAPYNEEWLLEDLSPYNSHVHLRNRHSNKCLTIQSASLSNNALAVIYTCDYSAPYNEEWRLL